MWSGWMVNASIAKNAHPIVASDAASPSMLSSKLNAFVIPSSQTTASAVAATPFEMMWTRSPDQMTSAAAPPCAASFASGGSRKMSSTRPATKRMAQPPRIPPSSRLAGMTCVATAMPDATSIPAKIPLPPSSGVERVCQRSERGAATTWRAAGVFRRAQIASRLAGRAARAAAVTVTGEGYSWAVKRVYG